MDSLTALKLKSLDYMAQDGMKTLAVLVELSPYPRATVNKTEQVALLLISEKNAPPPLEALTKKTL